MPINDARYYKTLLICPNRQFLTDLAPLLAHGLPLAPIQEIPAFPSRRQFVDILKNFEAKLALIDFSAPGSEPSRTLDDLHAVAPAVRLVALLPGNNPDAILNCLRQGASEFLIYPFTADQVDAALERIARILPAPGPSGGGKTVVVIPAKGSAGATTVACNLAHQCKRLGARKILLADMDPLTGTVSFVLKLSAGYSFMDVLGRAASLDADLWKSMITTMQGIDILLAPDTPVDPATELPSAAPIIQFAQETYEALVLDCGSPFGVWNLSIARHADEVLLLATNEIASLQAAQRTKAYLEQNRVDPGRMKLVVNRYVKDEGLNADHIPGAIGLEPFQVIPNDPETVLKSLMEGKPIQANSASGKALAAMADRLLDFTHITPKQDRKAGTAKGGLRGIFSR